ncbi:GmrSD restriction endonuclease domain-containing protein [Sediminibacterium sp.]|uniref:GmrSD restriction endonuclease domain-containing protein n=1 Tax=Sediminibacterium sp. TaxID=1917865 RepID=UPI003F6F92AC
MAKVNLDAIIPREDFEVEENATPGKKKETLSIEDIKSDSFFFSNVRKPDFQRETNEWDSKKIADFIESFLDGDLIPAIILWRSTGGYLFVIDGSHRLSSLAAWINDDYGDGSISKLFYDGIIPDEQIEIAEETRKLIRKRIGSYSDFKLALTNPEKVSPDIQRKAKNLAALAIQLQWVDGGANKAENSFFKINQQAAPIDKTELVLLEARKKPNCIAARAIIRSGKGHKYWSNFSKENQTTIQELAKEINSVLFAPKLETPIKTLDIPVGGKNYSAQTLPLILEFINIVNNIPTDFRESLPDDLTGDETVNILKQTRRIAWRINSNHSSSLGLHPVVYFYSQDGRHKVASFYATLAFVKELEEKKKLIEFCLVRPNFENILLQNDSLIQQINRKYRSATASYSQIKDFYFAVIELFQNGVNESEVITQLIKTSKFNYLTLTVEQNEITSNKFSTERKSAIYIKEALSNAPKCKLCGGYIHRNSISIDHIDRKQDGGLGTIDNGQITHPYCNTTLKN